MFPVCLIVLHASGVVHLPHCLVWCISVQQNCGAFCPVHVREIARRIWTDKDNMDERPPLSTTLEHLHNNCKLWFSQASYGIFEDAPWAKIGDIQTPITLHVGFEKITGLRRQILKSLIAETDKIFRILEIFIWIGRFLGPRVTIHRGLSLMMEEKGLRKAIDPLGGVEGSNLRNHGMLATNKHVKIAENPQSHFSTDN